MVPALHTLVGLGTRLKHLACGHRRRMPLLGMWTTHPFTNDLSMLRLSRSHQGDRLQHSSATATWLPGINDKPLLQHLPRVFENLHCLRAIVRSSVAVVWKCAQGQGDLKVAGNDGKLTEALRFCGASFFFFPLVERIIITCLIEKLIDINANDVLLAEAFNVVFIAPHEEADLASILLAFCFNDPVTNQHTEVTTGLKLLPVHADEDITGLKFAISR